MTFKVRAWIENDKIKCMSQMCDECKYYDRCTECDIEILHKNESKGCFNCGNGLCYTRINNLGEVHTSPPCTGYIPKDVMIKWWNNPD